jgi:hypothetical protein
MQRINHMKITMESLHITFYNSLLINYKQLEYYQKNAALRWKTKKIPNYWNSSKFQQTSFRKRVKKIPLPHQYMTAHFPGFVQPLQLEVAGLNYLYVPYPSSFMIWCGHASNFQMRVKCKHSHIAGWAALL